MDKELALKIMKLSIEAQRIDSEKWNIQVHLRGDGIPTWEDVCVSAMKIIS